MIYFISAVLIILGSVIIISSISLANDKKNSEKMGKKGDLFLFILDFITSILGMGNILLPIGLIFLGILILIYH
ncbi:hypothetical protein ACFC4S_33470 [Priestia megaterium]|uniref:hypothetical protein n=1 Tax=Priestia megaterium TaxID=1404 RepID=UPI0035DB78A0